MEIISGGRAVDYLNIDVFQDILVVVFFSIEWNFIVLVTELQISLDSCGRMLWALAIESMWQEHHQSVLDVPFCLTRD
jgi:hypothetical protein